MARGGDGQPEHATAASPGGGADRRGHRLSLGAHRDGRGHFLVPLLIFGGWSATRTASGIAITFILCNSAFGLLGNLASLQRLPPALPVYVGAVLIGALVGTALGTKRLPAPMVLKALGLVLVIAGLKLMLT